MVSNMLDERPPQCLSCRLLLERGSDPRTTHLEGHSDWMCTAFPAGIPDSIVYNLHDHRSHFPRDDYQRYQFGPSAAVPDPAPFNFEKPRRVPDLAEKWGSASTPGARASRRLLTMCQSCLWYDEDPEGIAPHKCLAFDEAIPQAVLDGRYDHRYPIAGDDGVRFEQHPNRTSFYADGDIAFT